MASANEMPAILVVTNDLGLWSFLNEGLVTGGMWTSLVGSGLQTLEVFRLRTFDLAIIDTDLGDLSALELVRRLRGTSDRTEPGRSPVAITIFMIADSPDSVSLDEVRAAGADELLVSPIEIDDLRAIIRETLERTKKPSDPLA
jgi:DNA-binding response OmpR family regulator